MEYVILIPVIVVVGATSRVVKYPGCVEITKTREVSHSFRLAAVVSMVLPEL